MTKPLSAVERWRYHLHDLDRSDAQALERSGADLLVMDSENDLSGQRKPYTAAQLDALRGAQDRILLSYLSIGEAEEYRSYWREGWETKPPSFLDAPNPEWPDNHNVRYWLPEWRKIVLEQVDRIVDAGFDGLYLDRVDAYLYWEARARGSAIDFRAEMAALVAEIHDHAAARISARGDTRDFVLMAQNGEELITRKDYRAVLDGLAKEDFRFTYSNGSEDSFDLVSDDDFAHTTALLEQAEAAGVEVFLVEYMTTERRAQFAGALGNLEAYAEEMEMPLLLVESRELDGL